MSLETLISFSFYFTANKDSDARFDQTINCTPAAYEVDQRAMITDPNTFKGLRIIIALCYPDMLAKAK